MNRIDYKLLIISFILLPNLASSAVTPTVPGYMLLLSDAYDFFAFAPETIKGKAHEIKLYMGGTSDKKLSKISQEDKNCLLKVYMKKTMSGGNDFDDLYDARFSKKYLTKIVKLIKYGASPNISIQAFCCWITPIVPFILTNDLENTRLLLKYKAHINDNSDNCLLFAKTKEMVKLLLDHGASLSDLLYRTIPMAHPEYSADLIPFYFELYNGDAMNLAQSILKELKKNANKYQSPVHVASFKKKQEYLKKILN